MKNKKTLKMLLTLCAALILMGGFSVTAYAQTPEGQDDATDDSGVVYEEPEKEEPLTPDGNATLVDDFGGNKQLITVTTKNGNYFYILIDRDDEGENTVHFLNQVDEADLMALIEDGNTTTEPPAVCKAPRKKNINYLLDITHVVLDGRIVELGEKFLEYVNTYLKKYNQGMSEVKVQYSDLMNRAITLGSISSAVDSQIDKILRARN